MPVWLPTVPAVDELLLENQCDSCCCYKGVVNQLVRVKSIVMVELAVMKCIKGVQILCWIRSPICTLMKTVSL